MTVEPQARLYIDARLLNLSLVDPPPPHLTGKACGVPRFVYSNSHVNKIDDKSGHDHILLSRHSQQYFGMERQGWWLVGVTLPFGWKNSPCVYQTVGLGPTNFFQEFRGSIFSLYRRSLKWGAVFFGRFLVTPIITEASADSYQSAEVALYIVCTVLVNLGYFLGISKCSLAPVTQIQYLGMIVELIAQAFCIPKDKIKIAPLREQILLRQSTVSLKSLQRLMGKCISFALAFPAAKFYIFTSGKWRWQYQRLPKVAW